MNKIKKYRTYIIALVFVIFAIVAYKLIDNIPIIMHWVRILIGVLSPFIIGFVMAFVLSIPVGRVQRLIEKTEKSALVKRKRGIAVTIVYTIAAAILTLILSFAIPPLARNLLDLMSKLPEYYAETIAYVKTFADKDGMILGYNVSQLDDIRLESIFSFIDRTQLATYAQGVFKFGGTLLNVFISTILSIYMLLSRESLLASLKRIVVVFLPQRVAGGIVKYSKITAATFKKYVYGVFMDALIVGVSCTIAFTLLGVPYSALLGIMMGLANIVPYFGAIVGAFTVALITLMSDGVVKAVIVLAIILVIQQLDGNVIQPKIIGDNVGIKPIYVLLALTLGGGFFGMPGMIFGVPVIAVAKIMLSDLIKFWETHKKEKQAALTTEVVTKKPE